MLTGIDIGGTKCAVVLSDGKKILNKVKFATTDCNSTIMRIISEVANIGNTDAIGISCGGPLDSKRGVIMSPPNLPGWNNIEICDLLQEKFHVPVAIQNDANACALAEWRYGAGKGTKNMIFLTFGTGMGAGLILNGQLYCGTNDMAGEIGHVRICQIGPVGYGKAGSFEGFCSGGGIAEIGKIVAKEELQKGNNSSFCMSYEDIDKITAKNIADLAKNGNDLAKKVFDICAEKLGQGLSILIDILNPELIVIGSVFARSEELLRPKMEKVIASEVLPYSGCACQVVSAKLGEEIGDYAAIAVAEDAFIRSKNK